MAKKNTKSKKSTKAKKKSTTVTKKVNKKSTPTKTTVVKNKSIKTESLPTMKTTSESSNTNVITIPKNMAVIVAGVLIALVVAALYFGYKWFVVVTVGNTPITRLDYVNAMEAQVGQQALDNLVTETLIQQEAAKQGIVISEDEVDAEIATAREELSAQGQELEQILEFQGLTMDSLRDQIRTQKQISKLAGLKEEVSEEEIAEYLAENAEFLPEEASEEELNDMAKSQLLNQDNQSKIQEYLTTLKASANVQYNVQF